MHLPPENVSEPIVIDFNKYPVGTRLELANLLHDRRDPDETPPGTTDTGRGNPNDPETRKLFPIMAFDVTKRATDRSQVPAVLARDLDPATPLPEEVPEDLQAPVRERYFRFDRRQGEWRINGEGFDVDEVDADPRPNTVERWILDNPSGGWGHPVHIHLGKFKIVSIHGRKPQPGELEGWQDVVWLGPNQRAVVDHQFFNFTGRYVFHCHNSEHEDHDMMSQFDVGGVVTRESREEGPDDPGDEDHEHDPDEPDDDEPDIDEPDIDED
ncbi:MAG: Bilirubin oxidase [Thermoleophilia bacterium]|nr:Bilirubin oxidase [Thermoleophilia bacterium]